jgi:hypothetical protein
VVISMQPLSDIRHGRATVYRHFLMCGLTIKSRGQGPRAGGVQPQAVHGPPELLLDSMPRPTAPQDAFRTTGRSRSLPTIVTRAI